jgi:hypothetical protein
LLSLAKCFLAAEGIENEKYDIESRKGMVKRLAGIKD